MVQYSLQFLVHSQWVLSHSLGDQCVQLSYSMGSEANEAGEASEANEAVKPAKQVTLARPVNHDEASEAVYAHVSLHTVAFNKNEWTPQQIRGPAHTIRGPPHKYGDLAHKRRGPSQ